MRVILCCIPACCRSPTVMEGTSVLLDFIKQDINHDATKSPESKDSRHGHIDGTWRLCFTHIKILLEKRHVNISRSDQSKLTSLSTVRRISEKVKSSQQLMVYQILQVALEHLMKPKIWLKLEFLLRVRQSLA